MPQTAKQKRESRETRIRAEGHAEGERSAVERLNLETTIHPDRVASAAGEIARPQHAGDKVVVGCKLGIAYYDLQLQKPEEKFEQNMSGGRKVTEWTRLGGVIRIRGTAYPRGTPPKGFPAPPMVVDGAALNFGIDQDFMEEWLKQNKLNPVVMNGMVFIAKDIDAAQGIARDAVKVLSGLDPVNPEGDPRLPRSTRRGEVSELEPGQR